MRALSALWPLLATVALGAVGLMVPGPVGDVSAYVWIGLFPGLALGRLLLPDAPRATRWLLGAALGPLAATVVAWMIVQSGQTLTVAARVVALGGWLLFAGGEARALAGRTTSDDDARGDRFAWGWALAAAAFAALPMLVSEWARVRSDGWVHAGIVYEILERGMPPQDPRFAGLGLNYVWFYNLFLALLGALRPEPTPFTHMVVANVVWIATLVWMTHALAWSVHRTREAARGALPIVLTGLNAGALLLWPLWLLRATRGEVRGWAEVERIAAAADWNGVGVMHQLSAPFAWMVNAWDKFMVGTALGYAYLLMLLSLWASVRWLGDESRSGAWRWLVVVGAAASGMMLFHSVVGLSAGPVAIGASLLVALLAQRGLAALPAGRALALAGAHAAGLAAAGPYFRSISRGWEAGASGVEHRFLHLDVWMPWTLLTACGVVAWLAAPALARRLATRAAAPVWMAAWMLGMTVFAIVVHLPEHNEFKFVWMVFAPLAVFAGGSVGERLTAVRRRLGPVFTGVLVFLLFALPSLMLLRGFLLDRSGETAPETARAPGDAACYAWVRSSTPRDAVFLDHRSRDVLLVEGRRRLLVGTPFGPERAAFPADQLVRRRAIMADLYGPCTDLAASAAGLDSIGAPVYVLYRAEDFDGATPWTALDAEGTLFERAYDQAGRIVYRRRP